MRFHYCLVLFVFASAVIADEVRTLGGKNVNGTLTSISETEITLKGDDGPIATPMSQVLAVNIRAAKLVDPTAKFSDVRLLDDTVLHCKSAVFQGKEVELTLLSGVAFKLPMSFILSYTRDAQNAPLARKFENLATKRLKRDRIVILRDGELNALEGSLGDVDAKNQTVKFKSETTGTVVDLPFDRLHGMIFYRADLPTASPICKVYDTEGNSLMALKLTHDGSRLGVTTTFGASVNLPAESLSRLDFNMGKLTFLSDMDPAKVVEKSGIGLVNRYRRDTNLDGEPILLDKQYVKGLSLHAYTELEYNLGGKYKDFKAILGIDLRTGADSQPKVTIYCDGREEFSAVVNPKKIQAIALPVKDVNTLKIVVSSRNFLDLHDHVTLAEARVSQ